MRSFWGRRAIEMLIKESKRPWAIDLFLETPLFVLHHRSLMNGSAWPVTCTRSPTLAPSAVGVKGTAGTKKRRISHTVVAAQPFVPSLSPQFDTARRIHWLRFTLQKYLAVGLTPARLICLHEPLITCDWVSVLLWMKQLRECYAQNQPVGGKRCERAFGSSRHFLLGWPEGHFWWRSGVAIDHNNSGHHRFHVASLLDHEEVGVWLC